MHNPHHQTGRRTKLSDKPDYLSVGELIGGTDDRSTARSGDRYIDCATAGRTSRRDLGVALNANIACCRPSKRDASSAGEASAGDDNCGAASVWPASWANACHRRE